MTAPASRGSVKALIAETEPRLAGAVLLALSAACYGVASHSRRKLARNS
jgi:hypothetical protein